MLDSCFQVIRGFRDLDDADEGEVQTLALPIAIKRLRFFRTPGETVLSRAVAVEDSETEISADISIIDEAGRLVALIEGFTCRRVTKAKREQAAAGPALYQERWIELAKARGRPKQSRRTMAHGSCSPIAAGSAPSLIERLTEAGVQTMRVDPGAEVRQVGRRTFRVARRLPKAWPRC